MSPFSNLRARLRYRNISLRYKVMLALIGAALIPLIIFIGIQAVLRYTTAVENVEANLEQRSQLTGLVIERNIESQMSTVFSVAQNSRLRSRSLYLLLLTTSSGPSDNTTAIAAMNSQLELYPEIRALRLLNTTGQLLAVAGETNLYPGLSDVDQRANPAFNQIVELVPTSEEPVLLTPYIDEASGTFVMEAATPLIESSTLYGYLIFSLDSKTLFQPEGMSEEEGGTFNSLQSIYTYLLDADGWLLTSIGDLKPLARQLTLESVASEAEEEGAYIEYERDWGYGPVTVTGRHYIMPSTGWTIVAEIPISALGGPLVLETLTVSVPTLLVLLLILIPLLVVISRQTVLPIQRLTEAAEHIAGGEMDTPLPELDQMDEIGALNEAFGAMTGQVRASILSLEQRVENRTRDLALITEIGREATSMLDVNKLMETTVNRITASFAHIYHAQVFLLDEVGEYAVLVASTGDVGRELLRRGHRLAVGSVSVIGRTTQLGETVVARDTTISGVHHKNEYLPDTRAEMALPLAYEGEVLGALDVQSKSPDVFAAEERVLFEALAAQLAMAIHNNRTFGDLQAALDRLNVENRRLTFQSWEQVFASRQGVIDVAVGPTGFTTGGDFSVWQLRALREQGLVVSPPDEEGNIALAIPLLSGGQALGVIEWQIPQERATDSTLQLARTLVSRLSITLDTIRLLERTERLAERERLVNQVSGQIAVEPNVQHILQTAVEELSQILGTSQVNIQLRHTESAPVSGPMESVQ